MCGFGNGIGVEPLVRRSRASLVIVNRECRKGSKEVSGRPLGFRARIVQDQRWGRWMFPLAHGSESIWERHGTGKVG
jgi:hypothetical protein